MKKIIIIAVCAILHGATALSQTADNATVYIINGEKITNFDGSQLKGKTVTEYRIGTAEKDGKRTTIHFIDVSDGTNADSPCTKGKMLCIQKSKDASSEECAGNSEGKGVKGNIDVNKALLIVDDKEYDGKISDISPNDIKAMNIYKPGSDVAKKYGEKGKNGVIYVHRKGETDDFIYFANGIRMTKADFNKLSPNKIKSLDIYKAGSKKAIEKAGEEGEKRTVLYFKIKE